MRIKTIRRVVITVGLAAVAVLAVCPCREPVAINATATVNDGDTIYSIATETAKQAPRSININRLAWQIQQDNGITDPGALQPGMVLKITYKEE